jgi:hypothetical protein
MTRTPHPNRRKHALAPEGRAGRLLVSLSPGDRAGLEEMARVQGEVEERHVSMAEVVRDLIRRAVAEDRRVARELRR